jgi:hypothetical protein
VPDKLSGFFVGNKKNNHLRVVVVFDLWSFLQFLFIFGPCTIFLLRNYPYIMML